MPLRWIVSPRDHGITQSLQRECGVSPLVAQVLATRGLDTPARARQFLNLKLTDLHPPQALPGVATACPVILDAIKSGQRITVYGDYDADGMTATAILYRCIQMLGGDVHYFVPNRLDDGYGLNCESLDRIRKKGTDLVITVDCGIGSLREVEHARELGMKIIVTDHHTPGSELPPADALIHPALPDDAYPFPGLCGAGVAFKLAWALCMEQHGSEKLPDSMREFLFHAIGLAAIGTIADVVPLIDENRVLVKHGLQLLPGYCNPGLRALMHLAGLDTKPALESEDIAFTLGPRLNAAGRLGQAQLGVELLTVQDESRALALAEYIDQLNKNRDTLENKIRYAARKMISEQFDPAHEPALVLAGEDWHAGVIGIVAGRLAERHHRPTVIIALDRLKPGPALGSARTACGINLYDALHQCREYLVSFGGHPAAAGLTIEPDRIDEFREAFCHHVSQQAPVHQMTPELEIDVETSLLELTLEAIQELDLLAPFGQANRRPLFCVTDVGIKGEPRRIGKDERHLSLTMEQGDVSLRAVGFGKAEWLEALSEPGRRFDFAFKPVVNLFRGRKSVDLHLVDYRVCESSSNPVASSTQAS